MLEGMVLGAAGAPTATLDRFYPVLEFMWKTTDPVNTVWTVDFPDALFAQPFIADKLRNFTYFKASVEWQIRVNAPKFAYGAFIASWDPATDMDASSSLDKAYVPSSGFPHFLVQPSDVETPCMKIPFVYPKTALRIGADGGAQIGSLDLTVVVPLTTITSVVAPEVGVTVYARFTDVVLDGPTEDTAVSSTATPVLL